MGREVRDSDPARRGCGVKFTRMPIAGAFVVEIEPHADERGMFARTFCEREFAAQGLRSHFVQCSLSLTRKRGMLRGMHLQAPPHEEAKLIRCARGRVYDVTLDLRADSGTFMKWHAIELAAELHNAVYIPEGCAHGFQALTDDCELEYQITVEYVPDAKRGVRWDDPAFGIRWPLADPVLSAEDISFGRFDKDTWTTQSK
jgi:dTDP-4-dehydrorhamnose 3,5-epimerase